MLQLEPATREAAPTPAAPTKAHDGLVPAVARALSMLDLLEKERGPLTMARLAARLSLPKSSVHGLCNTLITLGYLRRDADGYFIGPRVMGLAHAFAARTSPASEFAALWSESPAPPQETVILSVLDGAEVVYVGARHGARPLGLAFTVGMRLPAYRSATGKAMLAYQDDARLKRLLPGGRLPAFMNRPGIRRSALFTELAEVRQRGFSIDDESVREGVYCFGAPVFDASGQVIAGVGVCLQKATVDAETWAHHRDAVLAVARELSRRLGASPAPMAKEDA